MPRLPPPKPPPPFPPPPPPCPPPPPNAIAPEVVIVMPREIAVAAAISFLRIEVSPYYGSDRPSIENVWLRCRMNELQISQGEDSLTLSKKCGTTSHNNYSA